MGNRRNRRRSTPKETKDLKVKGYDKSIPNIPHNDPDWYIYDKEMFDGVISMPTLEFKGKSVPWKSNIEWTGSTPHVDRFTNLPKVELRTPTVAGYLMNPGLELNIGENSPKEYSAINVAARKMYAELSASNAKTSMYAPQDIATLILALGQIIAIATHLKRLYGVATYFNFYSRSIPEDLFEAMSVGGYINFKSNLANIRNKLNRAISKIDTIQFPAGLSYFKKCEYIYQNVFVDRDEKMVSYHVMAPATTWMLDEESYSEGTILKTVSIESLSNPGSILSTLEEMIEKVLTSSTFNFIFADILNLANRNVLNVESINIEPVPIDFVCEPIYSEQFNWQIMNMAILPKPNYSSYDPTEFVTPRNDVYPDVDTNRLIYAPNAMFNDASQLSSLVRYGKTVPIRLPDTNPSQDMFVELLAYFALPRTVVTQTGAGAVQFQNIPDYYCTSARIIQPKTGGTFDRYIIDSNCISTESSYMISAASQFVHFPFLSILDSEDTTSTNPCDVVPISRMSAYTQVDANAIKNLRYETYLGLFSFKK